MDLLDRAKGERGSVHAKLPLPLASLGSSSYDGIGEPPTTPLGDDWVSHLLIDIIVGASMHTQSYAITGGIHTHSQVIDFLSFFSLPLSRIRI